MLDQVPLFCGSYNMVKLEHTMITGIRYKLVSCLYLFQYLFPSLNIELKKSLFLAEWIIALFGDYWWDVSLANGTKQRYCQGLVASYLQHKQMMEIRTCINT